MLNCIQNHFDEVLPIIKQAHHKAREPFALPSSLPRAEPRVTCYICMNECSISEGGVSYCGLRTNLKQMAELSLKRGGCIKFDLKAWSGEIHIALYGVSNKRTLDNFRLLARYIRKRPSLPLLVASTLFVPGYGGKEEVAAIAAFISSLDPDIPCALPAFHPDFLMMDLPATSKQQAIERLEATRAAGLTRLRLGNIHLLHN